jgi:HrpA-like RNA helicase
MSLPTLLKKDVIIPHMKETKEEISNIKGIDFIMQWFEHRINNPTTINSISDKIIILKSATGSGKSTVLPSEFYLRFYKKMKKNILVTQPRILTTVSIPKDISTISSYKKENRNDDIGIELYKNIGYQTKEYVRKPLEKGILFCTIGVLLQFLKNTPLDKLFNKYGCFIIDEAHERSTNLDLILFYLKNIYNTHPIENCPFLIVASATMDVNKYAKYFNTTTIFEITGTSYPIQTNYLKYDSANIYTSLMEIIKKIHLDNLEDETDKSDIIVFIPSLSYIIKIKKLIDEYNQSSNNKLFPISLDSESYKSSGDDYKALFAPLNSLQIDNQIPKRKVIIATNVAETGITINSLKYCIDTGLVNQLEYNPIYNNSTLIVKPVTRSMALQRKGRVGRKHAGDFYPIYTENSFNSMLDIQYPEIFSEDLSPCLLNIIIIKYTDIINKFKDEYQTIKYQKHINIYNIDLLDNPSYTSINNALYKLYIYGLIYANGYPTKTGLLINKVRNINIENIKMILAGFKYGCNILDLVTIASYNTINKSKLVLSGFKSFNNYLNCNNNEYDCYNYNKLKSRIYINCEFIDFLLFFYKFQEIIETSNIEKTKEFCIQNKVNYYELLNLIELRDEIIKDLLFNMNMNIFKNNHIKLNTLINSNESKLIIEAVEEITKIKKSLYEGFKLNIAIYDNNVKNYIIKNTNKIINIDSYLVKNLPILQNGTNFNTNKPKIILYDSSIIKKNSLTLNYEFYVGNSISVLDGYVNIDYDFNS